MYHTPEQKKKFIETLTKKEKKPRKKTENQIFFIKKKGAGKCGKKKCSCK
jgi:hypothetical protein